MLQEIQWILDALAANSEKTRAGIARALNVDKSAITRLLKGERSLKYGEVLKIAEYLEVDRPTGFRDAPRAFAYEQSAGNALIYKCQSSGAGFWAMDKDTTAGRKPRDEDLQQAPLAFGVFAADNCMAPRFKIGELLWVNPAMPAGAGDDAIISRRGTAGPLLEFFPCEIRSINEHALTVFQYGRDDERSFPLSEWQAQRIMPRR